MACIRRWLVTMIRSDGRKAGLSRRDVVDLAGCKQFKIYIFGWYCMMSQISYANLIKADNSNYELDSIQEPDNVLRFIEDMYIIFIDNKI